MGLIGNGQGAGKAPLAQVVAELLELAAGSLVGDQQAIGLITAGPFLQPQPQPLRGALPLAQDRGAVAEHHKALQPPFLLHGLKGQQGAEGFAGTRASKHQHVLIAALVALKPAPEQLDQLLLPLSRLDCGVAELIGGDGDRNTSAGLLL